MLVSALPGVAPGWSDWLCVIIYLIEINPHYSWARPSQLHALLIKTNIYQILLIKSEYKRYFDCIIMIILREI